METGNNNFGQDANQNGPKHDMPFNVVEEAGVQLQGLYHRRQQLLDFITEMYTNKKEGNLKNISLVGEAIQHLQEVIRLIEEIK